MTDSPGTPLFIGYSHQDAPWLQRLHVHLRPLARRHAITVWDDTKIRPGMDWQREISEALASARVAVLLVSADFLASDHVIDNELPSLLEGAARDGTHILSLIVTPCMYLEHEQLARYQAVNPPTRPLTAMPAHEADETLVRLAQTILTLLNAANKAASAASNSDRAGGAVPGAAAAAAVSGAAAAAPPGSDAEIGNLRMQVEKLTTITTLLLRGERSGTRPVHRDVSERASLAGLEGAWVDDEHGTRLVARIIGGQLHVPCSGRANRELSGVYHDWARAGRAWFARFRSADGGWRGCVLHEPMAADRLEGTWWGIRDSDGSIAPAGTKVVWRRAPAGPVPEWAMSYFASVEQTSAPEPGAGTPWSEDEPAIAAPERPRGGSGRRVDREGFLAACSPAAAALFTYMLDEARRRGYHIYWGSSGFSAGAHVGEDSERFTFAYGFPPDELRFYFQDGAPWAETAEARAFRGELMSTGIFREAGRLTLSARVDVGTSGRAHEALRRIFEQVGESVRKPSVP